MSLGCRVAQPAMLLLQQLHIGFESPQPLHGNLEPRALLDQPPQPQAHSPEFLSEVAEEVARILVALEEIFLEHVFREACCGSLGQRKVYNVSRLIDMRVAENGKIVKETDKSQLLLKTL